MVKVSSGIRGSLGLRQLLPAQPEALVPTSLAPHLSLAHPGSEPVSGREGRCAVIHTFFFFFFNFYFIYLFIYGCVGSSFLAGAILHRGARASHYRGLSCCGAQAPDVQAQ